jgi:hypothetical protein
MNVPEFLKSLQGKFIMGPHRKHKEITNAYKILVEKPQRPLGRCCCRYKDASLRNKM